MNRSSENSVPVTVIRSNRKTVAIESNDSFFVIIQTPTTDHIKL